MENGNADSPFIACVVYPGGVYLVAFGHMKRWYLARVKTDDERFWTIYEISALLLFINNRMF